MTQANPPRPDTNNEARLQAAKLRMLTALTGVFRTLTVAPELVEQLNGLNVTLQDLAAELHTSGPVTQEHYLCPACQTEISAQLIEQIHKQHAFCTAFEFVCAYCTHTIGAMAIPDLAPKPTPVHFSLFLGPPTAQDSTEEALERR